MKPGKVILEIQTGKKEAKLSFPNDTISHVEKPEGALQEPLQLTNELSNRDTKLVHFLDTNYPSTLSWNENQQKHNSISYNTKNNTTPSRRQREGTPKRSGR